MAIKTFTTGSVLTAADTNTYLANSGLVYIAQATIGSSVSTVTISNCFSATYDAYQIVVSGGSMVSGDYGLNMQLGSTNTGYYNAGIYLLYTNSNPWNLASSNAAYWGGVGIATPSGLSASIFVNSPYLAKNTFFQSSYIYNNTAGGAAFNGGYLNNTTQYTGFTLFPTASLMSGGTVTVYGYRKA